MFRIINGIIHTLLLIMGALCLADAITGSPWATASRGAAAVAIAASLAITFVTALVFDTPV